MKRSMRSLSKQHSQAEGGSCPRRPSHGGRQWEAGGREIFFRTARSQFKSKKQTEKQEKRGKKQRPDFLLWITSGMQGVNK